MITNRNFAEAREIEEATVRCDINGAIKAASSYNDDPEKARELAASLCPAGGVVVGTNGDGSFQVASGDYHSLTVAATRAGKTRRAIVPMLLSLILADKSNFIVNDPKGELIEEARDLLELLGYEVISMDFRHADKSLGSYNPLGIAWELWNRGARDAAVDQLQNLAEILNYKMSTNTNDAFWPESSIELFVGLGLMLLEAGATREEYNMGSISAAEAIGSEKGFMILKKICRAHASERSYQYLSGPCFAPNDTAASIKSVFRSSISRFTGRENLADMMSDTSCSSHSFLDGRVALFIHTPDESSALSFLVIALIDQLVSSLLTLSRDQPDNRLPRNVEVILDEFGNLRCKMPDFDLFLAAACGHGIHLHLVMQSFSQFDMVYGSPMRKVALDNIEQWIYLGSRSLDTNKYFSEMIGSTHRPPNYFREPIIDIATLQRLERRRDESEAVMLIGSLKPFVAALPDLSLFERPTKAKRSKPVTRKPERKTFDLRAYYDQLVHGEIDELLAMSARHPKHSED